MFLDPNRVITDPQIFRSEAKERLRRDGYLQELMVDLHVCSAKGREAMLELLEWTEQNMKEHWRRDGWIMAFSSEKDYLFFKLRWT